MAFLGAIIQAVKGGVEKISNDSTISDLERDLSKDLFEDFTEEEKLVAQIKLKQADLELAEIKGKSRLFISSIEKELIALMEKNIKLKIEKLKQKEATQLDIANTMIAIQKTNNDLKDNLSKVQNYLDSKYNSQASKLNLLSEKVTRIDIKEQANIKDYKKELDLLKNLYEYIYKKVTSINKRISDIHKKQKDYQNELFVLNTSIEDLSQAITKNETEITQLVITQNEFQREILSQRNELYNLQEDLMEIAEKILVNENDLNALKETTQFQRWMNRIMLVLASAGLIVGIINYF